MTKKLEPLTEEDQALAYIFDVTKALAKVADQHSLEFLVYLLEMAALASAPVSPAASKKK